MVAFSCAFISAVLHDMRACAFHKTQRTHKMNAPGCRCHSKVYPCAHTHTGNNCRTGISYALDEHYQTLARTPVHRLRSKISPQAPVHTTPVHRLQSKISPQAPVHITPVHRLQSKISPQAPVHITPVHTRTQTGNNCSNMFPPKCWMCV
jgi:hypothetical protein